VRVADGDDAGGDGLRQQPGVGVVGDAGLDAFVVDGGLVDLRLNDAAVAVEDQRQYDPARIGGAAERLPVASLDLVAPRGERLADHLLAGGRAPHGRARTWWARALVVGREDDAGSKTRRAACGRGERPGAGTIQHAALQRLGRSDGAPDGDLRLSAAGGDVEHEIQARAQRLVVLAR